MRRFQFEAEVYESLSCVPMAVRRKLDRLGTKIGLEQWQRLGRGERLMICHAPAESAEECSALRLFIDEAMLAHCGDKPKELPQEARADAHPPMAAPQQLIANAAAAGVALTPSLWELLDDDQRYALIKLGGSGKHSHNLKAALAEFLTPRTAVAPPPRS
ncbi:MAG: nitrate reductase associated protein [Candidatus Binataceae bacterium]